MLRPKLPLLVQCLGLSLAINIVKHRTVDIRTVLTLMVTIFSVFNVLGAYAPKILGYTKQGMGFSTGSFMVGGAEEEEAEEEEEEEEAVTQEKKAAKDTDKHKGHKGSAVEEAETAAAEAEPKPEPTWLGEQKSTRKRKTFRSAAADVNVDVNVDINVKSKKHDSTPVPIMSQGPVPSPLKLLPETEEEEGVSPTQEFVNEPRSIMVNKIRTSKLCRALHAAGFNPKWSAQEIESLKATPQGRALLMDINAKALKLAEVPVITTEDIVSCYPHYQTDYITRQLPGTVRPLPAATSSPAKKSPAPVSVPKTGNIGQTGKDLKKMAKSIPKGNAGPTEIKQIPRDQLFPGAMKHCHWDTLQKELNKGIADSVKGIMDPAEEQKALSTVQYLELRSALEVRNLVNLFQSKSKSEWLDFFRSNVEREPKGYHIEGTTYYIPWDLFRKFDVCFGGQKI